MMSRMLQFFPGSGSDLTVKPPKRVRIPDALAGKLHTDQNTIPCRDDAGTYFVLNSNNSGFILRNKADASDVAVIVPHDYIPASPDPVNDSSLDVCSDPCWYDDTAGLMYALFGYSWADGAVRKYKVRLVSIDDVTGAVTPIGPFVDGVVGTINGAAKTTGFIQAGQLRTYGAAWDPVTGIKSADGLQAAGNTLVAGGTTLLLPAAEDFAMFLVSNIGSLTLSVVDEDGVSPQITMAPDFTSVGGRMWRIDGRVVFTGSGAIGWRVYDGEDWDRYMRDLRALATGI